MHRIRGFSVCEYQELRALFLRPSANGDGGNQIEHGSAPDRN